MKNREKSIIIIVSVFALIMTAAAVYQYNLAKECRGKIENGYQKSFTELVDYIGNIDTLLNKALVTNDITQLADISGEIWTETALAKSALGQLPVSNAELDKTSNFITQVGDYVHTVTQKLIAGGSITEKEQKQISQLADYSDSLSQSLQEMENDFVSGDMTLSQKKTKAVFSNNSTASIDESIKSIEEGFEDYPTLIYDGPFSEHILNKTPEVTKEPEVSKEKALKTAESFSNSKLNFMIDANGNIPSYIFVSDDNTISTEVSKNGGHIVMMTNSNTVSNPRYSEENASEFAEKFLKKHGYENMKQTGYTTDGNIVNYAFAYTEGDYTIYSDLIKIKVSLNDGKICGFESNGYLCNHIKRQPLPPIISEEQAISNLNKNLEVEKVNLALIPKENGTEAWCYEIKGTCKDKTFLVYVNTQTGSEEDILILIDDGSGMLTI